MKQKILALPAVAACLIAAGCAEQPQGDLRVWQNGPQGITGTVNITCPAQTTKQKRLCRGAGLYAKSSKQLNKTGRGCKDRWPSWRLEGQLQGETIKVSFDNCGSSSWNQLRSAMRSQFE